MSSNAMTIIGRGDLTPMEQHAAYIEEKRDIIKRMCMPQKHLNNDALFENFIEISKLTGLNPIRRQLYCVDYGQGPSIVTGIDGLRLIASRTAAYGGGDEYAYEDGEITQNGTQLPARASCTVYRIVGGMRCPFTCTVRWDEFGKRPFGAQHQNNWKTMPYHMLGKVAESHALRRAFPEETSGLYTTDEMAQAENTTYSEPREVRPASKPVEQPIRATTLNSPRTTAGKASTTQIKRLMAARASAGWTEEEMYRVIALNWPEAQRDGKPSVRELTGEQIGELILTVETPLDDEDPPFEPVPVSADAPIRHDEIVVEEQQVLTTA